MIKKTILLFLTFFFTACVERGYTPKPINHSIAKPIIIKTTKSILQKKPLGAKKTLSSNTKKIHIKKQKNIIVQKNTKKYKKIIITKPKNKFINKPQNDIFSLTKETKNKISGFFILIIGLIILL